MDQIDLFHKFLPDVLTREELPEWFIELADSRSKGKVAFVVWDNANEHIIYADYFMKGEYLETRTFEIKMKGYKRGKEENSG